jgi:AcrR family transcriptional regulator
MSNKRYAPDIRRELVLKAAVAVASRAGGWSRMTREAIAREAKCSDGLISRYLGDMPKVRKAVMKHAIKHELLEIIIQSIGAHDGYAVKQWLPAALKKRAIASLLG